MVKSLNRWSVVLSAAPAGADLDGWGKPVAPAYAQGYGAASCATG